MPDDGSVSIARSSGEGRTQAGEVIDGNQAAASVAYRASEVIAIYPITPASPMGELADEWAAKGLPNLWGQVPRVVEMQSEGGAAGAIHGALQAGALATSFTASQGLLLMIPNLYKIAGELTPFVLHVAARTLATHALSIFGDHSDVMACRQTGFAMLASSSVQEAQDMALVAHAATLESRIPFIHFFDGFRTSHELNRVAVLEDEQIRALLDGDATDAPRRRALTPDHPVIRGTAQNADVFFQAREACNPYYEACPGIVRGVLDRFAALTGRRYAPFDYDGAPDAERVVVAMGSGAQTVRETALWLAARGHKVGALTVRLYRPFDTAGFLEALPRTVRAVAVLDRTKEPGSVGEPLFLDVVAALADAPAEFPVRPVVIGGRYGLSSKEFTPGMAAAVFEELAGPQPKRRFTVGITDDVGHSSLAFDPDFDIEPPDTVRAVFFGLGSDGTVGANKNSLKIIAGHSGAHAQGYFVYDSRKAGATTVSHLRFGRQPVRAPWLIRKADFVACHHAPLLERADVLELAAPGAQVLLNLPGTPEEVWDRLPREVQELAIERGLRLHAIDASRVARDAGLGRRINTIMQTCFFALSEVMPRDEAIAGIRAAIEKSYGRRSEEMVRRNNAAVDEALAHLVPVPVPSRPTGRPRPPAVPGDAPDFVKRVTALMLAGHGDRLPVSAFPVDGTWPLGTTRYEKRMIATEIPIWNAELCIQCNKCAMVCPHAAIRVKAAAPADLADAPEGFAALDYRGDEFQGAKYLLQVAPDDCTGCTLCVEVCPAKDKGNPRRKALEMRPAETVRPAARPLWDHFRQVPEVPRERVPHNVKQVQLFEPLFEFSGACAGCGETPYVKLLTQLFGDRAVIANATGCSSIYGGNLPTTPYAANADGRGPAWANSLFEDNAEFGFGIRVGIDQLGDQARSLLRALEHELPDGLVQGLLAEGPAGEAALKARREAVAELRRQLSGIAGLAARRLELLADYLAPKSVWIVGGDGWAYDIGYGGLDHVLSSDRDVNVLVLDTEVYSNTGGQQSKATPLGASAKFAMAGRAVGKKDLGMLAMAYGHVYVAHVAFGAKDAQTVKAFMEAESYPGPSLIIAYSPCVAHGYDLCHQLDQQKLAVDSGHWPLFRYDPRRLAAGQPPLQLDSGPPKARLADFMANETRFGVVRRDDPERFRRLLKAAETENRLRLDLYRHMAGFVEPAAD
ncbi:pyruvate:ferredoxin (flavodoxin) oxidoreductase [Skermanella sp. TT6]|uniref:Pyruvate-flavodoxin oxidoreductase n=1 Tax=Skermanella cutis TaxID=2775420 RepID=A0ABX7B7K1_9PROT|nr:pyruvate:ferredoxin (flavodoxin) oxidoreductase [Skermanella sp. TT6]QQP89328.1 pyruvate:ferredoxin (flavodoxin) oxidoreductase [Skermanella sp. TT6]